MAIKNDPFAPRFILLINGIEAHPRLLSLVRSVEVEDESEGASSLSFTVSYTQSKTGGVDEELRNSKLMSLGNLITVRGGYGEDLIDLGSGYVTDLEPSYSEDNEPVIKVIAYDRLHLMGMNKSITGQTFTTLKDSEIVTKIAERNRFYIYKSTAAAYPGIRETKKVKPWTQKRGASDLEFLQEIAKFNAFDLYCKWNTVRKQFQLFFEPSNDNTLRMIEFVYGKGGTPFNARIVNGELQARLRSFNPKMSILSQFTGYRVFAWDKKSNKKIAYTMDMSEFLPELSNIKLSGQQFDDPVSSAAVSSGASLRHATFGPMIEVVSTKQFASVAEARDYLSLHMKKLAKDFVTGSAVVNGCQYLQSRQIHNFSGLGTFFDGKYFLKRVVHKFDDNGYNCDLDVRKAIKEQNKYV
jgi:phage protein D